MPKEYVESAYYGQFATETDKKGRSINTPLDPCRVRVGWTKDHGHVELATVAEDGRVLEPGPDANGWFIQLDRHGVNRLIRVLRRARDDAAGRDE